MGCIILELMDQWIGNGFVYKTLKHLQMHCPTLQFDIGIF